MFPAVTSRATRPDSQWRNRSPSWLALVSALKKGLAPPQPERSPNTGSRFAGSWDRCFEPSARRRVMDRSHHWIGAIFC
jgi:hypothetical protein